MCQSMMTLGTLKGVSGPLEAAAAELRQGEERLVKEIELRAAAESEVCEEATALPLHL